MARYAAQLDLTSARAKRQYSDILPPVIQALDDAVGAGSLLKCDCR